MRFFRLDDGTCINLDLVEAIYKDRVTFSHGWTTLCGQYDRSDSEESCLSITKADHRRLMQALADAWERGRSRR